MRIGPHKFKTHCPRTRPPPAPSPHPPPLPIRDGGALGNQYDWHQGPLHSLLAAWLRQKGVVCLFVVFSCLFLLFFFGGGGVFVCLFVFWLVLVEYAGVICMTCMGTMTV